MLTRTSSHDYGTAGSVPGHLKLPRVGGISAPNAGQLKITYTREGSNFTFRYEKPGFGIKELQTRNERIPIPELEGLVDKHFAAFQKFGRRTVEEAWQAGHYLNQAKARVAHGGWLGWIEKRGAQPRQAGVDPTVVL